MTLSPPLIPASAVSAASRVAARRFDPAFRLTPRPTETESESASAEHPASIAPPAPIDPFPLIPTTGAPASRDALATSSPPPMLPDGKANTTDGAPPSPAPASATASENAPEPLAAPAAASGAD